MTGDDEIKLRDDPAFKRLTALRARLSTGYSLVVLGLFAMFMVALALFREAMGSPLFEGSPFTLALLATFLMVALPIVLAIIFLRKTNRDVEPLRAELAARRDARGEDK